MNHFDLQPIDHVSFDSIPNVVKEEVEMTNLFFLPDEMFSNAFHSACDFFGIPEEPTVNADCTSVWPNNQDIYSVDVCGFNCEQLMQLGLSGEDSLTLIYARDCAHRALQGTYSDLWDDELACDFFTGIQAGLQGINLDNFKEMLGTQVAVENQPGSTLRTDFIEYGQKIAHELQDRHIEITYDRCIEYLNRFIEDRGEPIAEIRMHGDPICNESGFTGVKVATSIDEPKEVSFTGKYSDAEIDKMKRDVEMARSEMDARKKDKNNWESKVSLNDTKEHHSNGDYRNAVHRLNEAETLYNQAVDSYNSAVRKLNNAK